MSTSTLEIKKFNQEGEMAHEYNPLHNILARDNSIEDFRVDDLDVDLNNPVTIECQPSYDGTVNLITNDDKNPPRIVNTRFTVTEDNRYRVINRNQLSQTNLYNVDRVDTQTRLFRNIDKIPIIDFRGINNYGQLMGGNYTFYIKFADNDYNKTDIVAESGIVSIFKGSIAMVSSISGTLSDERTDKTINLSVSNIDTSFAKMYLYFTRDTSDINGIRTTKAYMVRKPYEIKASSLFITLNGFEETDDIDVEELNVQYNLVTAVKTQVQNQNMLFFGNVQGVNINNKDLQNISLYLKVALKKSADSIGWLDQNYKPKQTDDINQNEYYNPLQIYHKLGYWPGEIYRLGIVYILNDDSLSPVYNLRGHKFQDINEINYGDTSEFPSLFNADGDMVYVPQDEFLTSDSYLDNTKGVFRVSDDLTIHDDVNKTINPLYFEVSIPADIQEFLKTYNVKGYFLVRQKRIPITLAQGMSVGVDKISYTPMLYDSSQDRYISESFINSSRVLTTDYTSRIITTQSKQTTALLSLDANVNPVLQSAFDGSSFVIRKKKQAILKNTDRSYYLDEYETVEQGSLSNTNMIYVGSDVPLKYVNGFGFCTRAGSPEEVKDFKFFGVKDYSKTNSKLLRGLFCPIIGLNTNVDNNCIYDIKIQNYSTVFEKEYFSIRGNDNSAYFAITDRYELSDTDKVLDVYRGDCFTATITMRFHRNFIDSDVPVNELIVDPNTWANNYNGYDKTAGDKWLDINRADVNTVPIGTWITFKVLSNYNLGLRSEDRSNTEEIAIMGNPRTFYPHTSQSTGVSYKVEESWILNDGYDATLSQKRNILVEDVPYIKDLFDNRIMFSNVQVDDDFRNAYRIFQGLSYKDIDRQYGAIVKLLPWSVHLFCVFEHGLAIIPINEKALIQTDTDQTIHMYGAGVIQNQVSLISQDYGSIWPESVIRTPVGIYGVDTYTKKIWRFSEDRGLELISDMKVQRFLNDYIRLAEKDKYPTIALKNVKTHFNNYKGDVMFTFYNHDEDVEWNLCYNERMDKWITRYSWTPLYSENIDNIFYSLDKKRAEVLAYIYDNQHTNVGLRVENNEWSKINGDYTDFTTNLSILGYDFYDRFNYDIKSVISSYINSDGIEVEVEVPLEYISIENSILTINKEVLSYLDTKLYYLKIDVEITPIFDLEGQETLGSKFIQNIGIVLNINELTSTEQAEYNDLLINGFYVHGRAGVFDEIDYFDNILTNQILPTKWYDKQEPFELEFVVNNFVGSHKIFNNLAIISNAVEPESLEFEVIGDVYEFNKAGIYKQQHFPEDNEEWNPTINPKQTSQQFKENVRLDYDHVLNQYSIIANQPSLNIKEYGRMRGNIQYKEDSWYIVIEPIKFKRKFKEQNGDIIIDENYSSTRIRDKFLKVRVKYSGKDEVVITALKTFMTLSYS